MSGDFPPYLPPIPLSLLLQSRQTSRPGDICRVCHAFLSSPFPPLSLQTVDQSFTSPNILPEKREDVIHNDCLREEEGRIVCIWYCVWYGIWQKFSTEIIFRCRTKYMKRVQLCIAHLHKHCKTLLPSTKKMGTIKTLLWGKKDGFFFSLFGLLLSFLSPFLLRFQDYWKETETHDEPRPWLSRKKGSEKDTNALFPD